MKIDSNRSSDSYIATYDVTNPDDIAAIDMLRETVSTLNRWLRNDGLKNQFYVKLRGRGPRLGVQKYRQELPLKYAKTVDLYVYRKTPHTWCHNDN
jgi:hypothetical protein